MSSEVCCLASAGCMMTSDEAWIARSSDKQLNWWSERSANITVIYVLLILNSNIQIKYLSKNLRDVVCCVNDMSKPIKVHTLPLKIIEKSDQQF